MSAAFELASAVAEEASAWAFGWEALVAIGTGLLAAGTFVLALMTRSLAGQTARTADADQRALTASVAPLIIESGPANRAREPDRTFVTVRSVGNGPAVLADPRPMIRFDHDESWIQGQASNLVVPSGEILELQFDRIPLSEAVIQIAYTDVAGGQLKRTRLLIIDQVGIGLQVRGFALYEGADPVEPTLVSGAWREEDLRRPA